ncbi:MAG: hypothetical protein COT18_11790 [Elusimicrobia bacterium CG08_land_8_20_14_0_20_59_10]|nr:MAG: hypothetical protein COT18_11790 [Elusimicrobia bacterium CG08_land_8_20_14_0_20_59_10]
MKILLVDDDEIFRTLLSEVLEEAGFEISAHENGLLAWEALQAEGADIVVSDVNMPEMGGYELLKLIREDARFANIPVVMMALKSDVPAGAEGGADEYLLKPFPNEDLVALVQTLEQRILGGN